MNLITKILISAIAVLLIITGYFYISNNNYKKQVSSLNNNLMIAGQNEVAYQDQAKYSDSIISNLALKVGNLEYNNDMLNNKKTLLESKYSLLLAQIEQINQHANGEIKDSIVIVKFNGKQDKINYDGKTEYNLKNSLSNYSLKINIDPINIRSFIYMDNNNIIRNNIYADSTLIINPETVIDSSVFLAIRHDIASKPEVKLGFFDKLKLLANLESDFYSLQNNKLFIGIGLEYSIDKFTGSVIKNINESGLILNISYGVSFSEMVNYIFHM